MGTGSGSFTYDGKLGMLDYTAQEILKVGDEQVHKDILNTNSIFSDVRQTITSWGKSAVSYYGQNLSTQSRMATDLKNLTGVVSGLPAVITSTTEKLSTPLNEIKTQVTALAAIAPKMYTSMENTRTSILELVLVGKENNRLLENIGQIKPSAAPNEPKLSTGGNIPDYTGALNNISDLISNIRDSISGFDGTFDTDSLYSGLQGDLTQLKDVIAEMAQAYSTSEGFDVSGFTKDVQTLVGDFADSLVKGLSSELLPGLANEYATFVQSFTDNFRAEFESNSKELIAALVPSDSASGIQKAEFSGEGVDVIKDIYDKITQFHNDTNEWLENIDERLINGFTTVSNTTRRSANLSKNNGFSDVIDKFDDAADDMVSTGSKVGGILDWLKGSGITQYLSTLVGMFTFANIQDRMEALHRDTTMLIQATGVNRKEAHDLRTAVTKNLANTYGMAHVSDAEREQALSDAIRAGMVSQQHLEQATEVSLAYSKLLGNSIDFSQGWAKSLLITKTNADEYLEGVAISIDEFSNKFFVSADKLQRAAENYASTARVFSTDQRSFSKAINQAIGLMAAQEEAAIQSMDLEEWIGHLAHTSVADWTDTDYNRLIAMGMTDFYSVADMAMRRPLDLMDNMSGSLVDLSRQAKEGLNAGGSTADLTKYMYSHLLELDALNYGGEAENFAMLPETIAKIKKELENENLNGDITSLEKRAREASNFNWQEEIHNIAEYLYSNSDSFPGKILAKLDQAGVSPAASGVIGGIVSGVVSSLFTKFIGAILGGKGFGGVLQGIKGFKGLGGLKGLGGKFGGLLKSLKPTQLKGFPTFNAAIEKAGSKVLHMKNAKFADKIFNAFESASGKTGNVLAKRGTSFGTKAVDTLGSKLALGLSVFDVVKDLGIGAHNSEKWVGGNDNSSNIATGLGGLVGGTGSGVSGAIGNGLKWAAIGTAIGGPIGTVLGGALGAVTGAVGGEKISQKIKGAFDFLGEQNDNLDILMEEKLGLFGHAVSALKNTFIDWGKNWLGGFYKGFGDIFGGIKDGFSQILHGDFLGGLKTMGSGLIEGFKSFFMAPVNGIKDIIDDWTMSSKDRIKKRKDALKQATDEAEKATDAADKKTDDINKSTLKHTAKTVSFTALEGRSGLTSAHGLNSMSYTDVAAGNFVKNNNKPIVHTPGQGKYATAIGLDGSYVNDLSNESTVVKNGAVSTVGVTGTSDLSSGTTAVSTNRNYATTPGETFTPEKSVSESSSTDLSTETSKNTLALQALNTTLQILNGALTGSPLSITKDNVETTDLAANTSDEHRSNTAKSIAKILGVGLLSSGLFGIPGSVAGTALGLMSTGDSGIASAAKVKGPILKSEDIQGTDSISTPIVDSINTNMTSVIGLLEKLVNGNNAQQTSTYPKVAPAPVEVPTNSTQMLNYGHQEMGMV